MGSLAANGTRVKKRTMEVYVRKMAQIFSSVTYEDPHLDVLGKIDFRLFSPLRSYSLVRPAPRTHPPIPNYIPY